MKKLILLAIMLVAVNAKAQQFSSDEVCDLLIDNGKVNSIYMFIDAKDTFTSLKHKKFYSFKVTTETKLGEFFGMKKSPNGTSRMMTQHGLTYDFEQHSFGRMLKQIEEIPSVAKNSNEGDLEIDEDGNVPVQTTYYWNIYKLCKTDSCTSPNPNKPTVQRGEWHMTMGMDDQILGNQDVYYFVYPGTQPKAVGKDCAK